MGITPRALSSELWGRRVMGVGSPPGAHLKIRVPQLTGDDLRAQMISGAGGPEFCEAGQLSARGLRSDLGRGEDTALL